MQTKPRSKTSNNIRLHTLVSSINPCYTFSTFQVKSTIEKSTRVPWKTMIT